MISKNTIIPNLKPNLSQDDMVVHVKFNPRLDYQTNTLNVLEDIYKTAYYGNANFTALKIMGYKSFFMALAKVSDMEKPSHILFERMMK